MDNKQDSAVDKFQNQLNYLIGKGKKITSTDVRHIWLRCKIREKRNHCDTWLQSIVELKNSKDLIESKSFTEYYDKKYKHWTY